MRCLSRFWAPSPLVGEGQDGGNRRVVSQRNTPTFVLPHQGGVKKKFACGILLGAWVFSSSHMAAQDNIPLVSYQIINGALPTSLTNQRGDAKRGRNIILDRERGDCIVCHAMPLPDRQFHGTVGPPLDGVGNRYSAGELRLRLVDPKALNPQTVMPAYYKTKDLYRVLERYRGKPILTAQEIEDVVAYLLTLK
jgi:sulfur-oxidizing protein SoxX